ncbi:MAG: DUF4395 domain-containing protein [Gammaproteobacteria bacterium]|nr:DUF4395 domain-containing protein [Gammaproteobacteria bacterium]MBU1408850.1 DUF4395 domain-containing protein [Gammaproteobacteria bacterium]MBU1532687.1 DUF4395 domain-containing protein [Gammaproteobacteria bacterium]
MSTVFSFGERVAGYDVNVLNEREVRASAGILFFLALIAFMNAWLTGNFQPTRIFVVAFLIDFAIRVLINPRYAPSLVLGRFAVRNQVPEYVGATQKRFAWSIGLALALAMLFLVVVNRVVGPVNLIICSACLLLLFFEAAFGICIACTVYNFFHRQKARLCPGGRCEISARHEIQKISPAQTAVFVLFLGVMAAVAQSLGSETPVSAMQAVAAPAGNKDCTPPDWAVSIGHAEMWKLHNNCN